MNIHIGPELIYWGLIPTIIAIFIVVKTIVILKAKRTVFNWLITIFIIVLNGLAFAIHYSIFILDAWPTYIGHAFILLSLIILTIQIIFKRKKDR